MTHLIGIDVGTTSLKASIFNENLQVLASSRVEYPTRFPSSDRAEQDPEQWYRALTMAIRSLFRESRQPAASVVGVSVVGMSSLALPVDSKGDALMPGFIWLDRRAQAQSDFIQKNHHQQQLSITGNRTDPSNFAPKVMWIKDNHPNIYKQSEYFLHCNAYLIHKLTGIFSLDVSQCGLSQICDIQSGAYSPELIEAYGLDANKFPTIVNCNDIVGYVTESAAKDTSLSKGTPVVAGCMDNVAATLGLKLWQVGDAYISAGTATNVGVLLDEPVYEGRGLIYQYGVHGKWLLNGSVDYGAAGLHWFRNIVETDFHDLNALEAELDRIEHPLLFLPYMTGQRAPLWNDSAASALVGLTPGVEKKHIVKAIMEGVALGARHVFGALGCRVPSRLSLTGGLTANKRWIQIFCDVIGKRLVSYNDADVTVLGAAILAGVGVSLFADFDEAFAKLPFGKIYEPDSERSNYYDELYDLHAKTYEDLDWSTKKLDKLRRKYGGGS